jgi:hypothetical protein
MNEDREPDLQQWFDRSATELPRQPFALKVLEEVKRKERHRRLQRYAAALVAVFSVSLLIPQLIGPLNTLAALPMKAMAACGDQWPFVVLLVAGLIYLLVNRARSRGYLRGR